MNVPQKAGLRFEPEWRITLFTVVLLPLMVGLGFWQLQRAQEKAQIQRVFDQRQSAAPAALGELVGMDDSALAYRPVALVGEYLPGSDFLLDNRINKGRFGYEVLTPFRQADSGRLVLVNRGWVVADPARRSLPTIPGIAGPQVLSGQVYVPPGEPYTLGEQQLEPGWPKVIQLVDVAQLAGQLPVTAGVFPHVVRLASAQAGALAIDWQIINTRPEKHTAYAVQWFTMAAVLGLIYVLRSTNLGQLVSGAKGQGQ